MNGSRHELEHRLLIALPAMAATERPAPSLPVKVAAATRSSSKIACTRSPPTSRSGRRLLESRSTGRVLDIERRLGTLEACFKRATLPTMNAGAANLMTCQSGSSRHHGQHRPDRLVLEVRAVLGGSAGHGCRRALPRRARRSSAARPRTWSPRYGLDDGFPISRSSSRRSPPGPPRARRPGRARALRARRSWSGGRSESTVCTASLRSTSASS